MVYEWESFICQEDLLRKDICDFRRKPKEIRKQAIWHSPLGGGRQMKYKHPESTTCLASLAGTKNKEWNSRK